MPVVAAVLTLQEGGTTHALLQRLRDDPSLLVGELCGGRLPLVSDRSSAVVDGAFWRELEQHRGVRAIEFVLAADLDSPCPSPVEVADEPQPS